MLTCGTLNTTTGVISQVSKGRPQGNMASPILANLVLDKLDKFLVKYKLNFESGLAIKPLLGTNQFSKEQAIKSEVGNLIRLLRSDTLN